MTKFNLLEEDISDDDILKFKSSSEDVYDSDADSEFVADAYEISDDEIIVPIKHIERK
ncbi:hypothetical protein J6590_107686 [Homalodisca vitripennis]|nr:hypothetical protein J6590_107686 [Homalodisca vitripennis]